MERWKDIFGFDGYQVSNEGRVRSFWRRKHVDRGYGCYWVLGSKPSILKMSDDGNGYMKVMIYNHESGVRCCRKVHRLVAEAFIPNPNRYDTVDHIISGPDGKLDNSVNNLRWVSRRENIQKAYRDGVCDRRIRSQRKAVVVIDTWTGEEEYFRSIGDAAFHYDIDRSVISHILSGDLELFRKRYHVEFASSEEVFLYESRSYWDDY